MIVVGFEEQSGQVDAVNSIVDDDVAVAMFESKSMECCSSISKLGSLATSKAAAVEVLSATDVSKGSDAE
ncbi:uncharacterized protein MYCGRDRAFT_103691 [Zymoseptoria tritici IPO323]|uniref:Uncharacterized protein n=1 Tax=Zymoseptoria tritici (strain CBS 115943 / IPO323) TaxID=336722 RepID=F9X7S3_ZYMTI|nr:uncharacterized protein MYCGRDRAFT_103691 [Zymoseptoria tritici IPO323]EGP88784.1 hypothetical protein MYCGRDRAFT_103691 [Zymoseptoria tritici IPO323]